VATVVAFHAHPDDEVLLTGGTIARLAAEGHRVIIVVACDGAVWDGPDRDRRLAELRTSAAILGAETAVHLGYADSGHGPVLFEDPPGRTRFVRASVEEAAGRLAGVRVVEATLPRELVARLARPLLLFRLLTRQRLVEMRQYGLPRSAITHRVDVRCYAARKRAALAAHRTPLSGRGRGATLFRTLIKSPLPVFRIACGTEWFAEPGGRTGDLVGGDQAAGLGRPG